MQFSIFCAVKPSPYFTDQFRFFFKRFSSPESVTRWFLKRAGNKDEAISFPEALKDLPRTLVFLPKDMKETTHFLKGLSPQFLQITKFCVHESLQAIISAHRAHAFYYSDTECRYGEPAFVELEKKIKEFAPKVCVYLGEPFLPRLYLAKVSGASCRLGFNCEKLYPFLNLSLKPSSSSEAELLCKYYGVK